MILFFVGIVLGVILGCGVMSIIEHCSGID